MSKPPPPPRRDNSNKSASKPSTPTLAPTTTNETRRPSIPDSVLSLVDREAEAERKRNARLAATESIPRQVECYENERYYPFAGWSKKLFPTERPAWSNEEGTMIQGFTDFNVPSDWHWTTDWTIQRVEGGDPDGWMYAIDFGLKWKSTYSFGHCVRRRRWTRKRGPANEESELALKKLENARKSSKPGRSTPPTSSAAASLLSLYDDDTTSLQQKETETSRCIEYQRYYPVAGWSSKLLPTDKFAWSDVDGTKSTPSKDEWKVTPPWKWSSDWTIESDGDQDGWTYATDFTSSTWSDKKGFSDFVRKRVWTRDKEKPLDLSRPGSSSSNKSYDQFFHRLEAFKQDLKAEEEDDDVVALSSATY